MGGCAYSSEADDASCASAAFMAVPAVGPSVRAMLLGVAPISVLSVRGRLLGQSQRMPYLVSQGDTFRVAKSSNNSGRQNGWGRPWSPTPDHLSASASAAAAASTQNRRLVPTDKQNVVIASFPISHCLIAGHRRHYRRTHQDETLVNTGCRISPRC